MRTTPALVFLSLLSAGASAAENPPAQAVLVNERLAAYHSSDPLPSDRKLRFAYFLPSDRQPAANFGND